MIIDTHRIYQNNISYTSTPIRKNWREQASIESNVYRNKTISELAGIIETEYDIIKTKREYKLSGKQKQQYQDELGQSISSLFMRVSKDSAVKFLRKISGDNFYHEGAIKAKKIVYPVLLDCYEQYKQKTFSDSTVKTIRDLSKNINLNSRDTKKTNILDVFNLIESYNALDYAVNYEENRGVSDALKTPLVKEMLYKLEDLADDYETKTGIYFDENYWKTPSSLAVGRFSNPINKAFPLKTEKHKQGSNGSSEIILRYENAIKELDKLRLEIENIDVLSPAQKEKERLMYKSINDITDEAGEKNLSLIPIKTESDFPKEPSARANATRSYIQNIVFNRVQYSVQSALDGIEMFEKFGNKEITPDGGTIYNFALRIGTLAKKNPSEIVLVRFLELMEKIGEKGSKFDEPSAVSIVIRKFTDSNPEISEDTILRGIKLVKNLSTNKRGAIQLYNHLKKTSYASNPKVAAALKDLFESTKDMEM